jgi:hypothetical protein
MTFAETLRSILAVAKTFEKQGRMKMAYLVLYESIEGLIFEYEPGESSQADAIARSPFKEGD